MGPVCKRDQPCILMCVQFYVLTEDFDNGGRRHTFQYGDEVLNTYDVWI